MRAALLVAVAGLLAGCNLLQLTPTSEVIRTRVAGIEAEPAEITLGGATTLSALLVHEAGEVPALGRVWFACLAAESAASCLGLDLGDALDDGDDGGGEPPDLASGDFQLGIGSSFTYTAQGPQLEAAWAALAPEDRVEGLTVLVGVSFVARSDEELGELLVELGLALQSADETARAALLDELTGLMDGAITAARRVVVSDKAAGAPAPVPCAVDALAPNTNPTIAGIRLHAAEDGKDEGRPLGPVTFVQPGLTLTLRPELAPDATEDYLFIDRHGDTECRREQPFFAWLVNGGATVDGDYSFVAEEGDLDEVAGRPKVNLLTLPAPSEFPREGIDLWLVARDRRGGLRWSERRLLPFSQP